MELTLRDVIYRVKKNQNFIEFHSSGIYLYEMYTKTESQKKVYMRKLILKSIQSEFKIHYMKKYTKKRKHYAVLDIIIKRHINQKTNILDNIRNFFISQYDNLGKIAFEYKIKNIEQTIWNFYKYHTALKEYSINKFCYDNYKKLSANEIMKILDDPERIEMDQLLNKIIDFLNKPSSYLWISLNEKMVYFGSTNLDETLFAPVFYSEYNDFFNQYFEKYSLQKYNGKFLINYKNDSLFITYENNIIKNTNILLEDERNPYQIFAEIIYLMGDQIDTISFEFKKKNLRKDFEIFSRYFWSNAVKNAAWFNLNYSLFLSK